MEQSLVFIKPDGVERGLTGEILKRFEQRGIKLIKLELKTLTEQQIEAHYQEHINKPFFPNLKRYILSGPIALMVLEAENVISYNGWCYKCSRSRSWNDSRRLCIKHTEQYHPCLRFGRQC